jgi:hypothetical protein
LNGSKRRSIQALQRESVQTFKGFIVSRFTVYVSPLHRRPVTMQWAIMPGFVPFVRFVAKDAWL